MQHTVNDIWRLIYDYKITSLVVLNEQKFSRVSTDNIFWNMFAKEKIHLFEMV